MTVPTSINQMLFIQKKVQYIEKNGGTLMIVCSSDDTVSDCCQVLGMSLPSASKFSGRTALLPGNGRISIASIMDDPPSDFLFAVTFTGNFSNDKESLRMTKWVNKATQVLR